MGLLNAFGDDLKGLFGEGFADRAAIAGALLNGDYGAASEIKARQAAAAAEKDKQAQAQQAMVHAYAAFKRMGMDDDQAMALAQDPSVAADFISKRDAPQQFGASGGSTFDPITGQSRMAPSRHEFQGSVFDVGGGPAGQPASTTLQHQGYQWVTPQPGTTAFPVNSFTGVANMGMAQGGAAAQPGRAPIPVRTKAQVDALPEGTEFIGPDGKVRIKTGGQAGSPSPAGFP
jgi:hypothetical protein